MHEHQRGQGRWERGQGLAPHTPAQARGVWEQRLSHLEHTERTLGLEQLEPDEFDDDTLHQYAALRMGIHQFRAKLAWCQETIDRMRARSDLVERSGATV